MITLRQAALVLALGSFALLAGAFAFEHIGGLAPCVLCWYQRYPHMAAVGLGLAAAVLADRAAVARALIALIALAMIIDAGIAFFHVGVEYQWWEGTAECGSTLSGITDMEALRRQLLGQPIVRCTEVAWSMLGISMAGWNGLACLALAGLAAWTLKHGRA